MDGKKRYKKNTYQGVSGFLINPEESRQAWVSLRHSARIPAWSDSDLHAHSDSDEFYLLLDGNFWIWAEGSLYSLEEMEMLVVKAGYAHSIVRGKGLIEHFGWRAPAMDDRKSLETLPKILSWTDDGEPRELVRDWGYRIPLIEKRNRNCWLLGTGAARFSSPHLALAYLDFPTHEEANAGLGTRHRLHLHGESWETYVVLEGIKTLQIDDEIVTLFPGEMLTVSPKVWHTIIGRQAPYRGFTFRAPIRDDKQEFS